MQTGLKNLSVRSKLISTSLTVTGIAIIFSLIFSTIGDVRYIRQTTQEQLVIMADMIAASTAPALLFSDEQAANENLQLLRTNQLVFDAVIVDQNGNNFANYQNLTMLSTSWMNVIPSLVKTSIDKPIKVKNQTIGLLVINADMTLVWKALIIQSIMKFSVFTVIFLLSYLVLRKTSNYVLGPIQKLAAAIKEIIHNGDYSLRVDEQSNDELGVLTNEFNEMLSKIEERDGQLQKSNEALAQVQEPIMLRDAELRCEYVNPAFTSVLGYTFEELKGTKHTLHVKSQKGIELSQVEVYEIAREQGVYRGETLRQAKNGEIIPMQRHVSPIKDKTGKVKGYVIVLTNISEKKKAEEIIWKQANFDTLTGLPNRFMFMHRLKEEVAKIKRNKLPLGIMFLDLDRFKEINDTLGHDMGDVLLKEVAGRIVNCLRETDTVGYATHKPNENVARLGGDEFTVILSDLKHSNSAEVVAKRILDKLAQPYQLGSNLVHMSASIGIVETYPNESIDAETLIKYADIAMYESKQQGRNRYSKFTKSMLYETQKRRNLINDIHKALVNEEFQVVYQPIMDIQSNQIIKAEALIRWYHPIEGMVSPNDFIAVAEDAGLIVDIEDWVFEQVVQQASRWRKEIHPDFQISINKSPVQLNTKDTSKKNWFDFLSKYNVPGRSVIIEITEGVFLNKNATVINRISALRDAGMQISLDDFGTGYSSLSYLLKMDIDYIKIDQSFVKNLAIQSEDMALCEAMIVMAHKLGIKVVAEGIETQQQLDILTAAGCDYGQGYLLAKPMSAKALEKLCRENKVDEMLMA